MLLFIWWWSVTNLVCIGLVAWSGVSWAKSVTNFWCPNESVPHLHIELRCCHVAYIPAFWLIVVIIMANDICGLWIDDVWVINEYIVLSCSSCMLLIIMCYYPCYVCTVNYLSVLSPISICCCVCVPLWHRRFVFLYGTDDQVQE